MLRCLAKDPADRFPDAESLEAASARVCLRGGLGTGSCRPLVAGRGPCPGIVREVVRPASSAGPAGPEEKKSR